MLNGITRQIKFIRIINLLISYSYTILWFLLYDFLRDYLIYIGYKHKADISLGITIQIISVSFMFLSLIICILEKKILKILFQIIYLIFSSYMLLPYHPMKWIFFTVCSIVFLYFLNNQITLLKLKKSIKESLLAYIFIVGLFCVLVGIAFVFWRTMVNQLLLFMLQYIFIGSFILTLLAILIIYIQEKCK